MFYLEALTCSNSFCSRVLLSQNRSISIDILETEERISQQIWAGSPAKFLRELTEEEQASLTGNVSVYTELAELHAQENAKTFGEIEADKALRRKWDIQSDDYDSHLGIIRSKRPEIEFPNKMISKGPH